MKNLRPPTNLPSPFLAIRRPLSRRHFLRGSGVALALPLLGAMFPTFSKISATQANSPSDVTPRRFLGICNNIGVLPEHFFPTGQGKGYPSSPYLKRLDAVRDEFTVFSGVSHPEVDGGHPADVCFLTAAPHPGRGGFRNTISFDQYIAGYLGHHTRFPSLTLGVNVKQAERSLSYTRSGGLIPCDNSAANVYRRMFIQGTPAEVDAQLRKLDRGKSVLDAVASQAKDLQRNIPAQDKDRLDQYFTSVRDLEQRMQMSKIWEKTPKPKIDAPAPIDPGSPYEFMDKVKLMFDMARLAFESDSTRSISLLLDGMNSPAIEVGDKRFIADYHLMSHHGMSEQKLKLLKAADELHMDLLATLLADMKAIQEDDQTLLDRTMVLYGSNMNSANTHATTNLPIIFAGGGFRHGQHLVFDTENNYPLPNLFVSALHRLGIDTDRFASATGTMQGLETL